MKFIKGGNIQGYLKGMNVWKLLTYENLLTDDLGCETCTEHNRKYRRRVPDTNVTFDHYQRKNRNDIKWFLTLGVFFRLWPYSKIEEHTDGEKYMVKIQKRHTDSILRITETPNSGVVFTLDRRFPACFNSSIIALWGDPYIFLHCNWPQSRITGLPSSYYVFSSASLAISLECIAKICSSSRICLFR